MRDRGRLVVVATHNSQFLRRTNTLVRLGAGGRVESVGPTADWLQQTSASADFGGETDEPAAIASSVSQSMIKSSTSEVSAESESTTTLFDNAEQAPRVQVERSEKGTVRIDVYWSYMKVSSIDHRIEPGTEQKGASLYV